jgi:hypothetical protein
MRGLQDARRYYYSTWFLAIDRNDLNGIMKLYLKKHIPFKGFNSLLVILTLSGFSLPVQAQDDVVQTSVREAFKQYNSRYMQEKIFVHTNKDYFVSGEIAWFRIFYVDAAYNKPLTLSKMGYLELLDRNNRSVLQQKVSLKPGESHGSFVVPHTLPSGIYHLRTYTSWMKNFSADYYFEKSIRIVNPLQPARDSSEQQKKQYDIQFFPEGGNLVRNIESKVAFRVTDAYGHGLTFSGALVNSDKDTILRFQPAQMGIGHFLFTPVAGQTYKAVINFPDGAQSFKELPAVYAAGYVMNLSKTEEGQIAITVHVSPGTADPYVCLFIHNLSDTGKTMKSGFVNNTATFFLKPDEFGEGISHCTLFNSLKEPVCERLYFRYPENKLVIGAGFLHDYGLRKKIDVKFRTTDQLGKNMNANMSMAVYRLDSLQHLDETEINNYFYLQSTLGSSVESPSFYFRDENHPLEAMDDLMLTHGWRRFIWKDVLQKKIPEIRYPPEFNGHFIEGKLLGSQTGRSLPSVRAYLSVPSLQTQFKSTSSDSSGHVKFEMTGFYGSQEIIVQIDPKDDSAGRFEIFSPFSRQYGDYILPQFSVPKATSVSLLDQTVYQQVQHVYDGENISQFKMQRVDTNPFYVVPDEKYLLDDYTRFVTMEEVLREYVHSVNVTNKKGKLQLHLYDNYHKVFFENDPLVLIDGVPFFDINELFLQDPVKIKRLDLVNKEYILGYHVFYGIVNVSTYHGDLNGIKMNPHALVLDYPGIPEERQFFSPEYETELQINSRIPDYRTALYWAPEIKTDSSGKTGVSFYTSDIPGKYAVVIQGLSDEGVPGSQTGFFEVRK